MKKKPPQIKKLNADLINKFNKYPQENIYNHPIILKSTFSGAIMVGIIVALVAWIFSAGILGTEEPVKITSMNPDIFVFIGFITGSAIGGLIGNVYGIFQMLKKKG